ncbi:MAG: sigma-70 family RNA polymerase sigma factor [Oscillospiraceae bacterium]|nr:sigma-70 family RNA polymerase sigma factor [Oscillospiraceae bacterium]
MEDMEIIELYWQRDERAVQESDTKYGRLCRSIALRLLESFEDSEECVSDTWLRAWNTMPPQRPDILRAFFAKITRNLALDRCRRTAAQKRGGGEVAAALEELENCVSGGDIESEMERRELVRVLNEFLHSLGEQERDIFLRRYWLADSVAAIAKRSGMSANAVSLRLMRLRTRLKEHLEKEGISI